MAHEPLTWSSELLGGICDITSGGTPSRKTPAYYGGDILWAKITDITNCEKYISDTDERITEEALQNSNAKIFPENTVLLSMYGSIGKSAITTNPIATNQAILGMRPIQGRISEQYLYYYLCNIQPELERLGRGATQNNINAGHVKSFTIPVPPVLVQERIVEILQKADDIRHKRLDALKIAETILPVIFSKMFGDPLAGTNTFDFVALGEIADVRSGVTKGRKLDGKLTIEVPYLRVANVQDGFLDLSEIKTIEALDGDLEKYALENGDVLMTEGGDPDKLGRGTVWRNEVKDCIYQNHIFRVRTDRGKLLPEFLAALLRMQYAKSYFLGCAKRSSNLASVNSRQVKQFPIPLPPVELQQQFLEITEQFTSGAGSKLMLGLKQANDIFSALMQQAFTGKLTAAWEAAHAVDIAAYQRLHEQLPALLLLAFIQAKAEETAKQDAMLITALMKYAFLAHMEGHARRRLFHFVPYHYGPFSKEVYVGLEELQQQGVVTVEDSPDEGKTRIVLADPAQADKTLSGLPDDLRRDVQTIIDQYGALEHNDLLKTVYEKYPAYAKKSRITKKLREA